MQHDVGNDNQRVGAQLARHLEEIERRWIDRVSQELGHPQLSSTELRDSIPDYLLGLVEALGPTNGVAFHTTARKHALVRIRLGFDIDEVMQEFASIGWSLIQTATHTRSAVLHVQVPMFPQSESNLQGSPRHVVVFLMHRCVCVLQL